MATQLRSKPKTPTPPDLATLRNMADGDLLRRFTDGQDDRAFEVLVGRHGPLVMSLCRRVLQHEHDADDAFQATFLVLARKAGTIHKSQSLGSWLYKVAYRIALRARANRARRHNKEGRLPDVPVAAPVRPRDRDLQNVLDEEVHRLPEKYRSAVLLCYLQGRTNEEAARQLQCPTGTVKIRLLRARELLRKRLSRHGIGLSVALMLAGWTRSARAAVTPRLTAEVVQAGAEVNAGVGSTFVALSARAVALTEGWLRRLAMAKVKLGYSLLLLLAVLVGTDRLAQAAEGPAPLLIKSSPELPPLSPWYETPSSPELQTPDLVTMRRERRLA